MNGLPIGPGAFVPVVGPSGAGKDSLLSIARRHFEGCQDVHFARRVITRPCDPASEAHDTLTEAGFEAAQAEGAFALSWRSHGLRYGIPRAVDDIVAGGGVVVANVSRGVLAEIARRYARTVPVFVTVASEVLAGRLAARGRESPQDIAARIARNEDYASLDADCVVIDNSGSLEDAGARLVAVLQQTRHARVTAVC